MYGSPSLVCAQISRASLDVLHATPQMHAAGPQLDYPVAISLFYPNVSHPVRNLTRLPVFFTRIYHSTAHLY